MNSQQKPDVFASQRDHLRALAFRLLGHEADADDVVQEAWLRYDRTDLHEVTNVEAWLTTVVTRLCLDVMRRRRATIPVDALAERPGNELSPEATVELARDVETALEVVVAELSPPQRVALILHDVFGFTFTEIGGILGTSEPAARRQASRARSRIRHRDEVPATDASTTRQLVAAFLAAAQRGDVDGLVAVLHPEVVRTADPQALPAGGPLRITGADHVIAETAALRANALDAHVHDLVGGPVIMVGDPMRPRLILTFTIRDGRIRSYDVIADPQRLRTALRAGRSHGRRPHESR